MDMEICFPGGKEVDAHIEGLTVITDQPIEEGGTNKAPAPFVLFLASIGTCTGYYVLSFCQKHQIPTKNIRLLVHMNRNHETHLVDTIDIDIQVPKDFPAQYKNAVIKAADVCSVKRNFEKPPKITTGVTIH